MPRSFWWLAAAILLLGAGALVMTLAERDEVPPRRAEVNFPRYRGPRNLEQAEKRRTLAPAGAPSPQLPMPRRDPFLAALPRQSGVMVLIFEANALRHSRLGELFLECMRAENDSSLEYFQRESGIDPLKDIDRVAITEGGMMVSGFFDRARWEQAAGPGTRYGPESVIHGGGEGDVQQLGVWRNQLVVFGTQELVKQALDQVEGRVTPADPPVPEEIAYGEAYGVLPGQALVELARRVDPGLGERFERLKPRVELHADAMKDVAVVARVSGEDRAGIEDLGKALGAAIALGRMEAKARGDEQLAELLEYAQVIPRDGSFSLELALPVERLEKWFGECGNER